jgi:hypothetical protein
VFLSAVRERFAMLRGELAGATTTPRVNAAIAVASSPKYQSYGVSADGRLLIGLATEPHGLAGVVLRDFGIHADRLRASFGEPESSTEHNAIEGEPDDVRTPVSFVRQLANAAECARTFGHDYIGTEHLALSLLAETDGDAARLIERLGVDPDSLRDVLTERTRKLDEPLVQDDRLRFLRKANTEGMPHSDRALLDHLLGTRQLLVEWEARPALCDAGLFHSVYGTEYYELKAIPLTMRNEVQQLIGEEAETLAWLFCMIRRETLYENPGPDGEYRVQHRLTDEWLPLTKMQFQDLLTLNIANCLEPFPECSWSDRRHLRGYLRKYLRRFRDIAIPPAQRAFDRIDARWWEFWK